MKYICTVDPNGEEEIFVFPRSVNHDCMMEMIGRIKNKTHGDWQRIRRKPISAGFVNNAGGCYGHSETLKLKSREQDTDILKDQYKGF